MMAHVPVTLCQKSSSHSPLPPSRCFPSYRFLSFELDRPSASVCLVAVSVTSRRREVEVGIRSREGHLGRVEASYRDRPRPAA